MRIRPSATASLGIAGAAFLSWGMWGIAPAVGPAEASFELRVPRLQLNASLRDGDDESVLRRGLGRMPQSARPGEAGNLAIVGHRDTFFRPLERVRAGDEVQIESGFLRLLYRVDSTRVVKPEQVDVLAHRGVAELTLITCHPFRYVGHAPNRFVVHARQVGRMVKRPASSYSEIP